MSFENGNNNEIVLKPTNKLESKLSIDLNDSSNEKVNDLNERADLDFSKITFESLQERMSLKNILKIPNINGISLKSNENIGKNGEIINSLGKRFENIVHMGQNFSIVDEKGNSQNIVWGKNKKGEPTYVLEGTNTEIYPRDGLKIQNYIDFSPKEKNNNNNLNKENKTENKEGFKKNIRSAPAYKSSEGTTLCSRTARENLTNLGCKNVKQGSSARESFRMYGKGAESFPPKNSDTKIFDLYTDASPKNRKYGHRVVGVKINGEWKILDPYYNKTREPVSAQSYINKMIAKGRKIWGGFSLG